GWDGYFLGANTPVSDLLALIDEKKPRIVCLSLAIYFNINTLLDGIEQIQASYPGLEILAGGQAFRWGNTRVLEKYRNVTYIESVYLLEEIIRS
ncbi:MAG: cobalamin-dependent protein, partial [Deltaproteobacteria bacterium]